MWGKAAFLKHLENEIPGWIEAGWVSNENGDAILRRYDTGKDSISMVSASFGVLGVLLLLSGVITFFAANWDGMAKLAKLILLFAGMLGAYALAIKPFNHANYPRTWSAMLLLAAGMFGANIMLIAQIYHIESHYPNGVLLWAAGTLLLAWMVPSQAVMVLALALATLWTGMETFGFDHFNFAVLVFFLVAIVRIGLQHWRVAGHVAALAFLTWSVFVYAEFLFESGGVFRLLVTELLFVLYIAVFVAGLLMQHWLHTNPWASLVQRYSMFASLVSFYLLTGPWMHTGLLPWWGQYREAFADVHVAMLAAALLLLGGLAGWHHVLTRKRERPRFLEWARWLLGGCAALLVGTWFIGGEAGGYVAMAFNLFFFAGLAWLVAAGMHVNDRVLVNLAFMFFALTLITRYFDTFWSLMNRSFFFMAGGVLLLIVGFVLERQRRNFMSRIRQQHIPATQEGGA